MLSIVVGYCIWENQSELCTPNFCMIWSAFYCDDMKHWIKIYVGIVIFHAFL